MIDKRRIRRVVGRGAGLATLLAASIATLNAIGTQAAGATSGGVSNVTVSLSPPGAGDQGISTYTITFVATDGILATSSTAQVEIVAPIGTVFPGAGPGCSTDGFGILTDNTNPTDDSTDVGICPQNPLSTALVAIPNNVGAGDSVTLTIHGMMNPSTPGANDMLTVATDNDLTAATSSPYSVISEGYWLVGSDGGIFTFGSANFYGSTGNLHLQRPIVGITVTADNGGYWLVASDGGIFAFGDAGFYGSIPGLGLHPAGSGLPHSLNAPIVGMVPSANGGGYFMVGADGGVFTFGNAQFEGSCPGIGGCVGTAVAVVPDASGQGYWIVTNIGAVYAFGNAVKYGAPGNEGSAVTSAVRTPDGGGYWILFADGTVASFGDAQINSNTKASYGSGCSGRQSGVNGDGNPATAIFTASNDAGYSVAGADGEVWSCGSAPYYGGMNNTNLNGSIIAASGF